MDIISAVSKKLPSKDFKIGDGKFHLYRVQFFDEEVGVGTISLTAATVRELKFLFLDFCRSVGVKPGNVMNVSMFPDTGEQYLQKVNELCCKYMIYYIDGNDLVYKRFVTTARSKEHAVERMKRFYVYGDFDHKIISIISEKDETIPEIDEDHAEAVD